MRTTRLLSPVAATVLAAAVTACAPTKEVATDSATSSAAQCTTDRLHLLHPGALTVGTDSPAYDPWFVGNDPRNGKGFESAVAYAVAKQLGFGTDQVRWVKVPFNNSYKPGAKSFDFDINQISISPARAKVVDFSDGYYSAAQAVVVLKNGPAAGVTDLAGLAKYKVGAQTGTTSLSAIRDVIKPTAQPLVFQNTNAAKQALLNGQVDAIVADLPTAFYISAAEIPGSLLLGQFSYDGGTPEQFGMLFQKGNSLVPCVNWALGELKKDGTLAGIEKKWLSDVVSVPALK